MTASLSIIPLKVSALPAPSLAVIVWLRAVTWPWVTRGAPPWPSALPRVTTVSPTWSDEESANVTVGSPDTLWSIWITATSCEMSTPTTCAGYAVDWPSTVTVMLVEPKTTWLLVRISPVGLMSIPVPAAWLEPTVVLMSTIAGLTFAAIAALVALDELVPGVTGVIGEVGVIGDGVLV